RKISYKIINSPTGLLPKWKEHIAKAELPDRILPRDVTTRWNSTHDMLNSFLQMKTAISDFVDRSSHSLTEYALTEEEWEVAEGLSAALLILKEATLFFSQDGTNISAVIPAMDAIDEVFATGIINDEDLSEPIRHALAIGKKTLNKYYSLTDDSELYRIAMGTPYFSYYLHSLIIVFLQFSIRPTSSTTSEKLAGFKNGLTQPRSLHAKLGSGNTNHRMGRPRSHLRYVLAHV
ncbi:hypothetical protein EV361DRAFT_809106, partial [Lentinula raphanica]